MGDEPKRHEESAIGGVGLAALMAGQLIAFIVVGFLLGHWLDGVFGTAPWLTVIGVLVGIIAGFVGLFRLPKALGK